MSNATTSPRTVLMVEDDAIVLELGATVLDEAGYSVVTAATADEALALVRSGLDFDLLFTDIIMPQGMDGLGLAGVVREARPDALVLLTTGWAAPDTEQAAAREAWPLIGKPYRPADLVRRVETLLGGDVRPVE